MFGDAAAGSFYNPASLAWLDGNSFSASVGIYKKFDTVYGANEDFTQAGMRINQGFFRSLPASTGSVIKVGDLAVAMSIVVPDYENFTGDIKNSDTVRSSLNFVDESLWVGGSIAARTNLRESWGLSMYYTSRNYQRSVSDKSLGSAATQAIYSEDKAFTNNNIVMILGYQKNVTGKLRLGVSWRPPSFRVAGVGTYQKNIVTTSGIQNDSNNGININAYGPIPQKLTLGVAWLEPNKYKFDADFSIYGSQRYSDMDIGNRATIVDNRMMFNGSAGFEIMYRPWLRGRVGWFTNFSSVPDPSLDVQQDQEAKIDQIGWAANVAFTSKQITYTFGGYYTGGRGLSVQYVDQQWQVMPVTQQVFTMLVGTSYYF